MDALIHIVIFNEDNYYENNGFAYSEWKNVENEFLSYQKKERKAKGGTLRYIDHSYEGTATQYVNQVGEWSLKESKGNIDFKLSNLFSNIIEKAYPSREAPGKSSIPLYMPLKIGFIGNRLSGKTIIASKIAAKYGIMIIDPKTMLSEAF